ncbi:MAG: glycoside hydrolase family 2 [Paenibacillaceae bacterium]|nr:glycoside hydrolase family 2 [Paenibacillaceae bacterium]
MSASIPHDSSLVSAPAPRPEYPRPDWQRHDWLSLNGSWSFRFDADDLGRTGGWATDAGAAFDETITVPFSWASPLSGIGRNDSGIAWYRRQVQWSPAAAGSHVFLRFGAVDYACDVWVNGEAIGSHRGGYGCFELDATHVWRTDGVNTIVVRAEDFDRNEQARGKQGYGEIRGIWQPVWLEARPQTYVRQARFVTAIDGRIDAVANVFAAAEQTAELVFDFADGAVSHRTAVKLAAGDNEVAATFTVAEPKLWSPDSPYLYEGEVRLAGEQGTDTIATYFGIREIGSSRFGDRSYRWITLNGEPVYLNGTLDQSYHKTGYFTYPSDEEMKAEIYLMKRLGLNFVRIHIKPEEPRKLYWADKLGLLVMEDMPCFWGEPDERARASYESEAFEVIARDINHPSIFSWVMFNETWGLKTNEQATSLTGDGAKPGNAYLPETQEWVRAMYRRAKAFDPTRLVEDNSPCNRDHVETDLNTWHFYINGYEKLREHVEDVTAQTFPGSTHNYIGGNEQSDAPLLNSECGNVWGIKGGAGDSDLAWHYRYMLNEFRRHDKLCGFVFTEFRDVTNEFNGYYRLDGSDKQFGYEAFVPGMTIADLHAADFVGIDAPPCRTVAGGDVLDVPLFRSSFSPRHHGRRMSVEWELWYDRFGVRTVADSGKTTVQWEGYGVSPLEPLRVTMPREDAVAVLAVRLVDETGGVAMRNFATFDVRGASEPTDLAVPVASYAGHSFAYQWEALQGNKTNGGGSGSFVYDVTLPGQDQIDLLGDVEIVFEAGAKRLLARNVEGEKQRDAGIDFMHGASAEVEYNPNTYFMTDDEKHESRVEVRIDGETIASIVLPDDPADSRGVLSWHYQQETTALEEAGSYGYLCRASVPGRIAAKLNDTRSFQLELRANEGGLTLYGRDAGRYPIDLVVRCR